MAKSLEQHKTIIPGKYIGLWSAYSVKIIFNNGNMSHLIKLDEGIRGVNFKADVEVDKEGWVYVE